MSNSQQIQKSQVAEIIQKEEKKIQTEEIKIKRAEKRLHDTVQEVDQTIEQAKKRKRQALQKEAEVKEAAQKTISGAQLTLKAFRAFQEQEMQEQYCDEEGSRANSECNLDLDPTVSNQSIPFTLKPNQDHKSKPPLASAKTRPPSIIRSLGKPYETRDVPVHMAGSRVHWSELVLERGNDCLWLACHYCGINAVFYKSKDPKRLELLRGAWGLKVHMSKKHRTELLRDSILVEEGSDNNNRECVEKYIVDRCPLVPLTTKETVAYRMYKERHAMTVSEDCWGRSRGSRAQIQESLELITRNVTHSPSPQVKRERVHIDLTDIPSSAETQSTFD
ncbi:hypothetical protein BDV96DRAFT_633462 [Lophiotrema nucula]|uniref:Uncharacterized protein n=1 Tax=Lophiotrema nucula TaxID=690887 RepID=A0A6A5Z3A4_9PLEO|nr:hypothetical protein BDV96DRAFT_633462 [Lophiotrema nucula]